MTASMKKHALEYARQGFAVFPVQSPADAERLRAELGEDDKRVGEKKPFPGTRGVHEATTDEARIDRMWGEYPAASIAWCPAMSLDGLVAVDIDVDKGDGEGGYNPEHLDALNLPRTSMAIRTPSGGLHLVYALKEGELLPPSTSKVGHKIDIRCKGSYGLLPPSKGPDGTEYTWKSRGDPAFRSDALVEAAGKVKERDPKAETWLIEPDLPENVAEAEQWAKTKARTGTCGVDGNQTLAATGAMMHGFGLSEDRAMTVMLEHWNPRCEPPWSEDELRRHGESGWRSATNPPGNLTKAYEDALAEARLNERKSLFTNHVPGAAESADSVKGNKPSWAEEKLSLGFGHPDHLIIPAKHYVLMRPRLEWTLEGMVPTNAVVFMYGPPTHFKTFVAMDIAASIATGLADMDGGNLPVWKPERIRKPGPVLWLAGEGEDEIGDRLYGWCYRHNMRTIPDNFYITEDIPRLTSPIERWAESLHAMPEPPRLIVIDTLSRAMEGSNETDDAAAFMAWARDMGKIAERSSGAGTSILVIHHPNGQDGELRGSTVYRANANVVVEVKNMDKDCPSIKNDFHCRVRITKVKAWPDWEYDCQMTKQETLGNEVLVAHWRAPSSGERALRAGNGAFKPHPNYLADCRRPSARRADEDEETGSDQDRPVVQLFERAGQKATNGIDAVTSQATQT